MNARLPIDVRVIRRFNASPEQVFDAWLDPEKVMKWMATTRTERSPGDMVRIRIDARVGGSFSILDGRDGEGTEDTGEYLEIDRPELLVFTFSGGKRSPDEARVIVEIDPRRNGCELTLAHVGVPPAHSSHAESRWTKVLDDLAASLDRTSARTGPSTLSRKRRLGGSHS